MKLRELLNEIPHSILAGKEETEITSIVYDSRKAEKGSLFAKMRDTGCRYVVMEVSSQALKQKRTAGLSFDYGVYLNLSPDHIGAGEHADFAEYLSCKKLLFSQTRQTIANVDDEYWQEITKSAEDVVKISAQQEAIHYLIDNSGREDIVVFVGKGHEEYQEIRGRRYYFSEEKIVEEYLETK